MPAGRPTKEEVEKKLKEFEKSTGLGTAKKPYTRDNVLGVLTGMLKENEEKDKGGRPTKLTPECIQKLEDAYIDGATNLEAAIYAGISESLLYEHKSENPKFVEKIEALKGLTGLQAKRNVRKAVEQEAADDKGVSKSQWWLERRDKDFKPKKETDVNIGAQKSLIDAIIEAKKGK